MTPYEIAKECYGESLPVLLEHYMNHGTVYSDEAIFVMACTTSTGKLRGLGNAASIADCWYIHFAAGDLQSLFARIIPHELEIIAFERHFRNSKDLQEAHPSGSELRFLKMERVKKLLTNVRRPPDESPAAHNQPPLSWDDIKAKLELLESAGEISQPARQSVFSAMESLSAIKAKRNHGKKS